MIVVMNAAFLALLAWKISVLRQLQNELWTKNVCIEPAKTLMSMSENFPEAYVTVDMDQVAKAKNAKNAKNIDVFAMPQCAWAKCWMISTTKSEAK